VVRPHRGVHAAGAAQHRRQGRGAAAAPVSERHVHCPRRRGALCGDGVLRPLRVLAAAVLHQGELQVRHARLHLLLHPPHES